MAGQVLKTRRLVNPGKRRRMTPKQIKYFGTPRQKAGLKNRRKNTPYGFVRGKGGKLKPINRRRNRAGSHRRRRNQSGFVSHAEHAAEDAIRDVERAAEDAIGSVTHAVNRGQRRNVGEILTVIPANPGRRRKKGMAATKRRRKNRTRNRARARVHNRRRRNYGHRNYGHRRRRTSNPKVIVRYRNRRHHRVHNRRRNQGVGGMLSGDVGAVVGVLGGAAVTKIIMGFFPANLSTGWPGYITTGIVAVATGQVTGRMMNNRKLGNWMTVGGLVMVGLQVLADFFPQLQLPFTVSGAHAGTAGMGLLTSSNFFVPQVNLPGSMATFVTPAGIPAPVVVPATAMHGFGATGTSAMNSGIRRVGRLR